MQPVIIAADHFDARDLISLSSPDENWSNDGGITGQVAATLHWPPAEAPRPGAKESPGEANDLIQPFKRHLQAHRSSPSETADPESVQRRGTEEQQP